MQSTIACEIVRRYILSMIRVTVLLISNLLHLLELQNADIQLLGVNALLSFVLHSFSTMHHIGVD